MKLLVLQSPDNQSRELALMAGQNVAGRDPSNSLHLPSRRVSRKHCSFSLEQGRVVVRDLGSANGILVEGQRVREAELQHGQRVQVGDYLLQFVQEAPSSDSLPTNDPSPFPPKQDAFGGFGESNDNHEFPFGGESASSPPDQSFGESSFGNQGFGSGFGEGADSTATPVASTQQHIEQNPPQTAGSGDPFGPLPGLEEANANMFGAPPQAETHQPPSQFGSFGNQQASEPSGVDQQQSFPPGDQSLSGADVKEPNQALDRMSTIANSLGSIPWASRFGALLAGCLLLVMLVPGGGILSLLSKAEGTLEKMSKSHALEVARIAARTNEVLISQGDSPDLRAGNVSALDRTPGVSPGGAVIVNDRGNIMVPAEKIGTQIESIPSLLSRARSTRDTEYIQEGGLLKILSPMRFLSTSSGATTIAGGVYIEYEISEFVNDTGRPTSLSLIAFVVIGSIFVIIFTVTWRTTTRPVKMIREETELAMKGDLPQVSFESNWPEMDQLVHSINRVLRRATPGGSQDTSKLESLVELTAWPVILTDGQLMVTHANAVSARILSSDARGSIGKPLPNLVKDAAVAAKMKTLFASLGGPNGKQGSDTVVIDGRNRKLSILVESSSSGAPEYAVVVIT